MKKIECVVRPEKAIELEDKLNEVVSGMTVTHVRGYGTQKGETQFYRGSPFSYNLLSKIKIELVVNDPEVEKVCKTGDIGDGKIFVLPVEESIRIRTGERGEGAL